MPARVLAWFSCGAASAVAAKLATEKYGEVCEVVYCWTLPTEHPDNARFFKDIETWLGRSIVILKSSQFATVDEVFEARRYLAGIRGAPCTVYMKKMPRLEYQRKDDIHVFGYTVDEKRRMAQFNEAYPDVQTDWILKDRGITKEDCLSILKYAGVALPVMYTLGFHNNNCLGCVKASSPAYWAKIRKYFPDVFQRRAEQSRRFGARLIQRGGKREFLDELPEKNFRDRDENITCGPDCGAITTT